jgi:hypothetical protein
VQQDLRVSLEGLQAVMKRSRLLVREARFAPFRCACCDEGYEDFVKASERRVRRRCGPCRMRCLPGRIMACQRRAP